MWMHNGNIGGWKYVKQALAFSVDLDWFNGVQGSTDSEWAFALFLDVMKRNGHDPDADAQDGGFGHVILREAMLETIKRINKLITDIPTKDREGLDTRSLLNFAVADGDTVVCTRYVSSATDEAASLYFSSGTSWREEGGKGNYKMERRDKGADIVLVASEPLTFERGMCCFLQPSVHLILTLNRQYYVLAANAPLFFDPLGCRSISIYAYQFLNPPPPPPPAPFPPSQARSTGTFHLTALSSPSSFILCLPFSLILLTSLILPQEILLPD